MAFVLGSTKVEESEEPSKWSRPETGGRGWTYLFSNPANVNSHFPVFMFHTDISLSSPPVAI